MNLQTGEICGGVSVSNKKILNPMQPLNKEEISFAAEVVKNHLGGKASTYRFETIQLVEPSHEEVSAFQANKKITRSARVVVYRFGGSGVNIFEVLLTTGVIFEEKYI